MVFEKFGKKREEKRPQTQPPIIHMYHMYQQAIDEVRNFLARVVDMLTKIEQTIQELTDRVDRLEKAIEGYYIVQISHIPATLQDLVKMLNLKGAVVLKNNSEVDRFGNVTIDPREILTLNFNNILHVDRDRTHIYAIRSSNKIIIVESERTLDYCTLGIIKRFLDFF